MFLNSTTEADQERIDRFETHIRTHILNVARRIGADFQSGTGEMSAGGFFLLAGLTSYYETIGQFLSGFDSRAKSKQQFVDGMRKVHPSISEDQANLACDWLRNGLYHDSCVRGETHLSRHFKVAIQISAQAIFINPYLLFQEIERHFEAYVTELRHPTPGHCWLANFLSRMQQIETSFSTPHSTTTSTETTANPMKPANPTS